VGMASVDTVTGATGPRGRSRRSGRRCCGPGGPDLSVDLTVDGLGGSGRLYVVAAALTNAGENARASAC